MSALPALDVAIWPSDPFLRDGLFSHDPALDRDGQLSTFRLLRERLEAAGGSCHTVDVMRDAGRRPDLVVHLDVPVDPAAAVVAAWHDVPRWVVLQECEAIHPWNWDVRRHAGFERVFTWHDELARQPGYVLQRFASIYDTAVPEPLDLDVAERNLCSLIAGNKRSAHPQELYSARIEAIRWFERHHLDELDLYGIGWNRPAAPGLPAEPYPSYMGPVATKREVLGRYWFSICFENARDIPGYVTEKIFDCLLARTVPVYWGAGNIDELVPAECFVDMRRFGSFEALYDHLVGMEPEQYVRHLDAARSFLAGAGARPFSAEGWVDVLLGEFGALRRVAAA